MTSKDYQQQLQDMGDMPDFQTMVANAYDKPVLQGITKELANTESQYLPSIFQSFTNQGTGAGDMSAAAKLANIGNVLGRLTSKANASGNVLNFYGAQINDLANKGMQQYQSKQQTLKDLYSMALQREQMDQQARLAKMQMGGGMSGIADLYKKYLQDGTTTTGGTINTPKTLDELNALRAAKGLTPVSQAYWDETYNKSSSYNPNWLMELGAKIQDRASNAYTIANNDYLKNINNTLFDITKGIRGY